MNTETIISLAGVTVVIARLCGLNPMLWLQRSIVRLRALGYLAREMAAGAWSRRSRWEECCERARREA